MKVTDIKTQDSLIPANRLAPGQRGVVVDPGRNHLVFKPGDVLYGTRETEINGTVRVFAPRTGGFYSVNSGSSGDTSTIVEIDTPRLTFGDLAPGDVFVLDPPTSGFNSDVCVLKLRGGQVARLSDGYVEDWNCVYGRSLTVRRVTKAVLGA